MYNGDGEHGNGNNKSCMALVGQCGQKYQVNHKCVDDIIDWCRAD